MKHISFQKTNITMAVIFCILSLAAKLFEDHIISIADYSVETLIKLVIFKMFILLVVILIAKRFLFNGKGRAKIKELIFLILAVFTVIFLIEISIMSFTGNYSMYKILVLSAAPIFIGISYLFTPRSIAN